MEQTRTLEHAAEMLGRDLTFCWHPYRSVQGICPLLPVIGAEGAEIITGDGRRLIDATSSWWVNLHGHAHPYLIDQMIRQIKRLDHVMFADFTHEGATLLAEKLCYHLPGKPQRFFYSDNGSTAVETALKIALQYWHNLGKKRSSMIAFEGGFHGETFGAMSLSCRSLFSQPFIEQLFAVERIPPPALGKEEASLTAMQRLLETKDAACFIFEPIVQGAAGMRSHSAKGLQALMRLCKQAGVITIANEVMTGCGRLGSYFACEKIDLPPDIICLSKSLTGGMLPLGVTACRQELFDVFDSHDKKKAFLHGHSYCANPIGCAAALASLELLFSQSCDQQRLSIEKSHKAALARFSHFRCIERLEVIGTLMVIEIKANVDEGYHSLLRDHLYCFYLDRGVHLRPLGNVIYFLPPYCITQQQLELVYEAIEASFLSIERGAVYGLDELAWSFRREDRG